MDRLDPATKVSFAAACAQSQIPWHLAFSELNDQDEPNTLITILECAWWDALGRKKMSDDEVRVNLDRCMALIPKEDEGP